MANKFSRWMPPTRTHKWSPIAWCFFTAFFVILSPVIIIGNFLVNRRLRRLAAERNEEDIGTFARAFDRRSEAFDPWVVRATWDALRPYVVCDGKCLPLRPSDRLVEDLCIDPDDIYLALIDEVAERSRHSLDKLECNPQLKKIETVGDFVKLITLQPRAPEK